MTRWQCRRRPVPVPDRPDNPLNITEMRGNFIVSTLFVGIDVSQAEHVVCTMTADGTVSARLRVPNHQHGIDQLIH